MFTASNTTTIEDYFSRGRHNLNFKERFWDNPNTQ